MLIKHACFSYLPQRYHKRASFEEIDLAYKLHSFKDGRNFAKRWAANVVCDTLSLIDMTDTIFLCIPASCQHTHARRFKKFSAMVCQKLHAVNGYDYIHVIGKRPKAHISKTHELAENTDQYVQIDDEKLAGRNVVLTSPPPERPQTLSSEESNKPEHTSGWPSSSQGREHTKQGITKTH